MKGLFKYKDSANWWYRYSDVTGKRHYLALRTSDEVEAIQRVRSFQGGTLLLSSRPEIFQPKDELHVVIEKYLRAAQTREDKPMRKQTAAGVKGNLDRFARAQNLKYPAEVDAKNLTAWIADLRAAGKAQDSVFTYARDVCAFSRWLAKERYIPFDTLAQFKRPKMSKKGRKNWVRMAEASKAIAQATDPDLKFILYCGFHAGLRKAEICALKVGWFELGSKPVLHVQNDPAAGFMLKDSDNRSVPLSSEFANFLRVFLKNQLPSNYALRPQKTKSDGAKYRVEFRKSFLSHMKKCGVVSTAHDMRRSFASNLVSKGVSIYSVAQWLGDRVDVVQRSYGYLETYNEVINVLSA